MSEPCLAVRADLAAVSSMLGRAFADDPVQRWLFSSVDDPAPALEAFMGFFVERYFDLGHVYVSSGPNGASLWAPPDRHALGEADVEPLLDLMRGYIGGRVEPCLVELGRALEYLPAEPHLYLGIAGVDRAAQGLGFGAALLVPGLALADAGGFAVHLESSNPRNIPFYRRHGFEPLAEFCLGGPGGPLMTPMRREPQ